MDNSTGIAGTFISISSSIAAIISLANAQVFVTICAGLVAMISGFMAARYYYYATKEKKQNLKPK